MSAETRLRSGGHTVVVTLASDGDGVTGHVDGVAHRLRLLAAAPPATPPNATVEELALEVDGRPCRAVVAHTGGRILVAMGGRTHAFEIGDETRAGAGAAGSGTVVAPMPGKVVNVLVAVGDTVTAGQPLVVIEAMKMETTLAAEVAGTVSAVNATPGAMADAGTVLVEITPTE